MNETDQKLYLYQHNFFIELNESFHHCRLCSFFLSLQFSTVPTAAILGGPDVHVDKGSTINLTCAVKYSPEPPAYIFWYHHDEVSKNWMFVRR